MTYDAVILGSGPAGLIAADTISAAGHRVLVCERRAGAAWRLLVAGSSGLNVAHSTEEDIPSFYSEGQAEIRACLNQFSTQDWLHYLEGLGEEPYLGTSRRYFIRSWKGASLQKNWLARIQSQGGEFAYEKEFSDWRIAEDGAVVLSFLDGTSIQARTALFALGGLSWENPLPRWPQIFERKGLRLESMEAENVGYELRAPESFFREAAGQPIKGLILKTKRGVKQGELMITHYGLEGTPVYTVGCVGPAEMDLKPEIEEAKLAARFASVKGDAFTKIGRVGKLSPGALALVRCLLPNPAPASDRDLAKILKAFPLEFTKARPLEEAISTRGGLSWGELDEDLAFKKSPALFGAGEMLAWNAPTGGFLLTASVSTGFVAAQGMLKRLQN